MKHWFEDNAMALVIAVVSAAITYTATTTALSGRLLSLEKQVAINQEKIAKLDGQQNDINVQLAGIAKDIQYIKEKLTEL